MAVLFVVYMPNEDREPSEYDDPGSPAPQEVVADVNGSKKTPCSDDENEVVAPKISVDLGDDDEFSAKKPLLGDGCSDRAADVGSTSGNKLEVGDAKLATRHQSLVTLNTDQSIPRWSSENILAEPENAQLAEGVSDSVVYKGDKVRFKVTKLDASDQEGVRQPAAEVTASVVDLCAEMKDEKKQSLLADDQETDVVMERLTLKEVCVRICRFIH